MKNFGKKLTCLVWKTFKYVSFFYVGTNYLVPVGVVICRGTSMEPTLKPYNILLIEKSSVRRDRIFRDDIVVLTSPNKSDQLICKRVYQCPNEQVDSEIDVPYGYVYLKGDNPEVSNDSRSFGAVPYGLIKGRVFMRVWPLSDFRIFDNRNHRLS